MLHIGHLEKGLVVAVAMDHRRATELRRLIPLALQELSEKERLRGEPNRGGIIGKQVHELVPEDGDAARLESDHGNTGGYGLAKRVEDAAKLPLCAAEHAVVVERPPAAQTSRWKLDAVARRLEDLDGRLPGLRAKVVRERVGPEEDAPVGA